MNKLKNIRKNILTIENFCFFVIILSIFVIDRYSKIKIISNLSEDRYYLNEYLNFELIWNTGIGFGLFSSNNPLLYNSITVLIGIIILFFIFLIISSKDFDKMIYSMIAGGALGNFYDRISYKAVPDFIDLHYNNFHWFTFNVADIFITIGVITFFAKDLLKIKKK